MTVLKIILIALLAIIALILVILMLRIRFILKFEKGKKAGFAIGILCFTIGLGNKKTPKEEKTQKKPNKLTERIKKSLGLDIDLKDSSENGGIYDTVSRVITLVTILAGQIKWLLTKFRLDRLHLTAICSGEDAADAAMDYGLVCAAVYPFIGFITASVNAKKDAEKVSIGCDFDGNSFFEFNLTVSVRIFYIVKALMLGLIDLAENAQREEASYEQQ